MVLEPNAYLREVATALTRREDLTDREALDVLYELALRIYALLLRELPAERFARTLAWRQLRPQVLLALIDATNRLAPIYFNAITAAETQLQPPTAAFFALPPLPPRQITTVLDTTRVLGIPLSELFAPAPPPASRPLPPSCCVYWSARCWAHSYAKSPPPSSHGGSSKSRPAPAATYQ